MFHLSLLSAAIWGSLGDRASQLLANIGLANIGLANIGLVNIGLANIGLANIEQSSETRLTLMKALTQRGVQWIAHLFQAMGEQFQRVIATSTQQMQTLEQTWENAIASVIFTPALWQIGLYWLLLLMMVVGFIGSFVPILPGVALVLLAVIIWGVITGFSGIVWPLVVAIVAFVLSIAVDNLAGLIGAQKAGASRW
ncbi:MAG: DUF456 family protein, partial [Cyanothece sp. SIO2G6]|nr:DUF456 family protein [Cyanothece sp. SIO2G6]